MSVAFRTTMLYLRNLFLRYTPPPPPPPKKKKKNMQYVRENDFGGVLSVAGG